MKPIPTGAPIDIVLVDDHPVTRFALKMLLEQQAGWRVVQQCQTPRQVVDLLRKHQPHVLIIDLLFTEESGLDLLEHVRTFHPSVRPLVYSMRSHKHYAARCRQVGAMGYICKDAPLSDVVAAVQQVLAGKHYVNDPSGDSDHAPATATHDDGEEAMSLDDRITSLSNRELEVLQYLGAGLGTKQIADAMCRSVKTIETYRWRIRKKLQLGSSLALVQYAVLYAQHNEPASP